MKTITLNAKTIKTLKAITLNAKTIKTLKAIALSTAACVPVVGLTFYVSKKEKEREEAFKAHKNELGCSDLSKEIVDILTNVSSVDSVNREEAISFGNDVYELSEIAIKNVDNARTISALDNAFSEYKKFRDAVKEYPSISAVSYVKYAHNLMERDRADKALQATRDHEKELINAAASTAKYIAKAVITPALKSTVNDACENVSKKCSEQITEKNKEDE